MAGEPRLPSWLDERKLQALDGIVTTYWTTAGRSLAVPVARECIGRGASAVVYKYNALGRAPLVVRIACPERQGISTESDVMTMSLLTLRTTVPVPKVFMYCPTRSNPVGAEWIMMQFMPGEQLSMVWDAADFTFKRQVLEDVVHAWSQIFNITSPSIGCVAPPFEGTYAIALAALRFSDAERVHWPAREMAADDRYSIGPLDDPAFSVEAETPVPPAEHCGPFAGERDMLEALAFRGKPPTRKTLNGRWSGEQILKLQKNLVIHLSSSADVSQSTASDSRYHLCHEDFQFRNCLVSPKGHLSGLVDYQGTGFVPAWEAASAPGPFNEDAQRCIMQDDQEHPMDYEGDEHEMSVLRAYFRRTLYEINPTLYYWFWVGVEQRAIKTALSYPFPSNAEAWIFAVTDCTKYLEKTESKKTEGYEATTSTEEERGGEETASAGSRDERNEKTGSTGDEREQETGSTGSREEEREHKTGAKDEEKDEEERDGHAQWKDGERKWQGKGWWRVDLRPIVSQRSALVEDFNSSWDRKQEELLHNA